MFECWPRRREARQLGRYGIEIGESALDYGPLLERVREVFAEVGETSTLRRQLHEVGVTVLDNVGTTNFVDPHTLRARRVHRAVCVAARPILGWMADRILQAHRRAAQVASVAIAAEKTVGSSPGSLSFPNCTNVLGRAALDVAREFGVDDVGAGKRASSE
jgi:hypothetical protein